MKWALIVAATPQGGIGLNGYLPWHLPEDLKRFKRITTETKDPNKRNALVMGRKTWESFNEKNRPLPGRLNIVLSTRKKGRYFVDSLQSAKEMLSKHQIETVFCIGGGELYSEILQTDLIKSVYLTVVHNYKGKCDVFIPAPFESFGFSCLPSEELPVVSLEKDLWFEFLVYDKIKIQ